MPRVFIPAPMRDLTGGAEVVAAPGRRVGEVIEALERLHPGVKARLCDGDALRSGIAIIVDTEVSRLGLRQPVTEDSEVHFLPAIGGGQGQRRPGEVVSPRTGPSPPPGASPAPAPRS